ncbi:zinc finger MYM-type protein 1-like [Zingiber officinale]|uniref:zinc finger MYM-type protein 1-like n=1 Tax=Zingiber officinale TaxID=94328 RepID=UPI001C4AB752|nr:zinc finger MYM-type protein 1-like [Zingiber officinale]
MTLSTRSNNDDFPSEIPPKRFKNTETEEVDLDSLECDPGLRRQIWEYHPNQRDEIRRVYLNLKVYQPILQEYPLNKNIKHPRRFQSTWYEQFPWLEYSPTKDKAYCFPCFIFNKPSGCLNQTTFTADGFDKWKKVRNAKACAFLGHMGKDNVSSPIVMLKRHADIHVVLLLALQGIPFRGHDEKSSSSNRGNFLEFLDVLTMYNDELSKAIAKAPKNAKYTSHGIQKQILHVLSVRVKNIIREEIGVAKYCIIVDEARDASKREQMSIVLRFVDSNGFIQEHFFGLVYVSDTAALTLKDAIYSALAHYNLDVQNIRGQGYDGASNMRGEFNGLQALIIKDCKSAYYVHCFAHRLQLTLVAAAKKCDTY